MRYKRKRAKYVWLPGQWYYEDENPNGTPTNAIPNELPVAANGSPAITFSPIVLDSTLEDTDVNPATGAAAPTNITIADIVQSNEYFIKRICGNIWCVLGQDSSSTIPGCLVEAGLFVARADSNNDNLPIGSASQPFNGYDPAHPDTIREPWIWRRSWLLANSSGSPAQESYNWGPAANYGVYDGGLRTGPFVDQKTARRIKSDERLFLAVSARAWPPVAGNYTIGLTLYYTREFRVLGQLRRARTSGTF